MEGSEIDVFVGIDMAKTDHFAQVITTAGKEVIARPAVNDQAAIEQLLVDAAEHGDRVAVVVDMTASAAQLLLTVAAERRVPVAYVTGLQMRRAAELYAGSAKTDPRDAWVLADFARRNADRLAWLDVTDELLVSLRVLDGRDVDQEVGPCEPIRQRIMHAVAGFLAGYSGTTLEACRLDLRGWIGWLDNAFLDPFEIERAHIELYARWSEAQGKARSTIGRRLSTICGFYKYCAQERLIERDPSAHVRRPKQDYESSTLGLDRNEIGAFLVQAGLCGGRDHALACLLALNGLRISEALGTNIDNLDVNRGHRTLFIHRKGNSTGTPPTSCPPSSPAPVAERCQSAKAKLTYGLSSGGCVSSASGNTFRLNSIDGRFEGCTSHSTDSHPAEARSASTDSTSRRASPVRC